MDKMIRAAREHREISETLAFFQKSLHLLPPDDSAAWRDNFRKFLDEYIVNHFQFEEREFFGPVLERSTVEAEKAFIAQLQKQHLEILSVVARLKLLLSQRPQLIAETKENTFMDTVQTLIEMALKHAFLEDEELLPLLKKYGLDL